MADRRTRFHTLLICRDVSKESGNTSLRDLHDMVVVRSLPGRFEDLWVYTRFEHDGSGAEVGVRIAARLPSGSTCTLHEARARLEPDRPIIASGHLGELVFEEPGRYLFTLEVDGEVVTGQSFEVALAPPVVGMS
jgi:hypothetical protein